MRTVIRTRKGISHGNSREEKMIPQARTNFLAIRMCGSSRRAGPLFFFEVVPASGPVGGSGLRRSEGADTGESGFWEGGGPLFLEERGF